MSEQYVPGLANVPAAESSVCYLDGKIGKLQYRGYPIEVLAEQSTFEEVSYLLLNGALPTQNQLKAFDAELRKSRNVKFRLIDMLNLMRPWLEGRTPPAAAPASSSRPTVPPAPSPTPTTLEERLQAIGSPPPSRSSPVPPASPPSQSATISKEDRPSAPANSIVSQIDAILQERLAGTPLEERGIFLTQSPEGSVNVYVGLTRYNGIDDVPDAAIRAAIRAAIAEWENKYTPGL